MASVNKVIVLGNLGKDPEVRYTPSGAAVCSFSVATTRHWKNKESGERQEETEWHRVALYERLAEIAGEYLNKGSPVYIEGRLKTRKWQNKEGQDVYTTEIVGESLQLLGSKRDGENEAAAGQRQRNEQRSSAPTRSPAPPTRSSAPQPRGGFDDMDDDIPFDCPYRGARVHIV